MNAEEVVTELRSLKSALIIASVDLTNAEQRREMENSFSALVDYTNDAQAEVERLKAKVARERASARQSMELCRTEQKRLGALLDERHLWETKTALAEVRLEEAQVDLATARGVIAKVEKATDENEGGWIECENCRERKGGMGYYLCSYHSGEWDMSAEVRAILSETDEGGVVTDNTQAREARKGLVVQPVSGPTPETILAEMGVSLPQHPTMSYDGNGACKDRNRHCDKCDLTTDEPTLAEKLAELYREGVMRLPNSGHLPNELSTYVAPVPDEPHPSLGTWGECAWKSQPHERGSHVSYGGECRDFRPTTAPVPDEGAREAKCVECDSQRVTATRCNIHALEQLVYRLEADKRELTAELAEARRELTRYDKILRLRHALADANGWSHDMIARGVPLPDGGTPHDFVGGSNG